MSVQVLPHPSTRLLTGRVGGYVAAAIGLRIADEGGRVVLVLLALQRAHSAAIGGLLVAGLMIPHVLAAPAIGAATDWLRRPCWVIAVCALGFGGSLAVTAVTFGHLPTVLSVLLLVLGGSCGPALTGGLSSQIAGLVEPGKLARMFGVDSLTYSVSGITGPAIAGTVGGLVSPAAACFTLAGFAVLGAALVAGLPVIKGRATQRPSLILGLTAIAGQPRLATVTLASAFGQLGPGALPVVAGLAAAAQGRLAETGFLLTAVAVGGLVGSLLWTARPASIERSPRIVMLAMCGVGLPLLFAGAAPGSTPLLTGLFAISGCFLGPFTGALFSARDALSPAPARAQVFTIGAGLKTTAAAAGSAGIGLLASWSLSTQFAMVGLNSILAGLLGLAALGLIRRHEAESPAA